MYDLCDLFIFAADSAMDFLPKRSGRATSMRLRDRVAFAGRCAMEVKLQQSICGWRFRSEPAIHKLTTADSVLDGGGEPPLQPGTSGAGFRKLSLVWGLRTFSSVSAGSQIASVARIAASSKSWVSFEEHAVGHCVFAEYADRTYHCSGSRRSW